MRYSLVISFLFFFVQATVANPLNSTTIGFDIKKANQQFDRINLQLSIQNLNIDHLNNAVTTLAALTANAEQCMSDVQKKLDNIDLLIKQGSVKDDNNKETADLVYLEKQQKELADDLAQCRLFSIRAKEATEAYKITIAQLIQEQALTRGTPLWTVINQTISAPPELNLMHTITSVLPNTIPPLLFWLGYLCMAIASATILLTQLSKTKIARHYLDLKKIKFNKISLMTLFIISAGLFIHLLATTQDLSLSNLSLVLSGILLIYTSLFITTICFFKIKKIRALFYWYSLDIAFFQSCTITLLSFYIIGLIGTLFSHAFNTNSPLWQLYKSSFILCVLITGGYFIYYFCNTHRHLTFVKHHHRLIKGMSLGLLSACAIIDTLGYYTLAEHITFSGFTTCLILFITMLITQGVGKLYLMLNQQPTTKTKILKYFGYRKDQIFTEFLILKTVAQAITLGIGLYLIGQTWGFATDFIGILYDKMLHGIPIANVMLYPTRIIAGLVVFCFLYLLFRAISTVISSHHQFEEEEETQVAIASILTYIGFTIAIITGCLVAGFDFTGLAIIAGALSVGIGLGLQSIVNNFVSGLILLIEKPIRPGDRINVDGLEGFVKKIRVRSTQITTPAREDIIIPNSDLITRPVTNYMFSDKYCRIHCELGVAYGSDTLLVKEVLLSIANQHEEIIKSGRNKPIVLFSAFADNTLVFQLHCLIRDVNKKAFVQSDLNFAIEKSFREHHIDMPFPQREIHIKYDELPPLNMADPTE